MNYPGIRIEGSILSPDIFGQIEEQQGQRPVDFGLDSKDKVKDEIARTWADAFDYWRIFQRKLETVKDNATTETRNQWIIPLLGLLHYDIQYQQKGAIIDGRTYAFHHIATNRADTPVHIIGAKDSSGLDKKPENARRRMSAHALIQEFLNLHEQLYGIVTNGSVLRLLRDSSRLVKLSYLEFDLDRIFRDKLFADFALLYRIVHATRLPLSNDTAAESLIEQYHQDSLEQGARIREGLSSAVKDAVLNFGNGFLKHPDNSDLQDAIEREELSASDYYQQILRLIYRLLFLMVIEERGLVYGEQAKKEHRDIYYGYYSVSRLRHLSENRALHVDRHYNLWFALLACFRLFEADGPGHHIGITPLAGHLFSTEALRDLNGCKLGNEVFQKCLHSLSVYRHPESRQLIRVNYAALNVEEFGSVYEGLLEFESEFIREGHEWRFQFRKGKERSATGSHYTPDDLVQPLIKHSLDHLIDACLKKSDPASALLDLRVADIACGSGHILLAAARRIATQLAIVQSGEEQPSPEAYRDAIREVISGCIYGVDLNPLAVELCKVALWLEAHIPGKPLNFLDHHIKCGNAIVGFAHFDDLKQGVPVEAFKALQDDDKELATVYRKRNKKELNQQGQLSIYDKTSTSKRYSEHVEESEDLANLPDNTLVQLDLKSERFYDLDQGEKSRFLRTIASIPIAQFYTPKTLKDEHKLITDSEFRAYYNGQSKPTEDQINNALQISRQKRFFHWFLEFPEIMKRGGFDCILGNPPYLGGQALSGNYGYPFCEFIKWGYAPAGLSDLVVFFLRRIYGLLREGGFLSIITTNSIIDGRIRKDGLAQIVSSGGEINMAIRGMKWPGVANLVVSTFALHKGEWNGPMMLDNCLVNTINTYFEEDEEFDEPKVINENRNSMFQGSIFLGDGFLLSHEEAHQLIALDSRNAEVIMSIINGIELTNNPDQLPGRSIINFKELPIEKAQEYEEPFERIMSLVKPIRATNKMKSRRENWWQFGSLASNLYNNIKDLPKCFAATATTKYLNFSQMPTNIVFGNTIYILTSDRWDLISVVQSTLHEVWARKYSGKLSTILRYSPSKCFNTFTFPKRLWQAPNADLAQIGERYHAHRKELMLTLWLGLTDVYNLFHDRDLSPEITALSSKKDKETATAGYEGILELRRLHVSLDIAVRDAYGWQDLDLEHGFHEVEMLPENDRTRYTISPKARREVLKRLLAENHARTKVESQNDGPKSSKRKLSTESTDNEPELYD